MPTLPPFLRRGICANRRIAGHFWVIFGGGIGVPSSQSYDATGETGVGSRVFGGSDQGEKSPRKEFLDVHN